MGLRCSVLGHRYGARERIEEREETGDEVIVTVRDVKTCDRCGSALVVSESKEVTAAPRAATEDPVEEVEDPDPIETDPDELTVEPSAESPASDDGVILEDERPDRERGEWPAVDQSEPTDDGTESAPDEWPEVDVEADEGYDAVTEVTADEIEIDEVIQSAAAAQERDEGEETISGFFKASSVKAPADPPESDVLAEYFCPRCSWSRPSIDASVRAGDICPDCRIGYIAERDPR